MASVVSLGFRTDLMLLKLQGSTIVEKDGYRVIRSPMNPAHYWGNFLLLEQPMENGSVAGWIDSFRREIPDARHIAFGVDGTDGHVGDRSEILGADLTIDASTVLSATALRAPAHSATDGELRMLASDDDWAQALELKEATREDEDPDFFHQYAKAFLESKRDLQNRGHGGWFGAFVDGTLVSHLGVFGDGSGIARYQTVETHPDFRKRGYAGSLVQLAGEYALDALAASTLVIVADPDYTAIGLYRSLGFDGTQSQIQIERRVLADNAQ